ncbi:MAG: T9SS type A sorting domain-containing protein [Ignavibacteria bacterium]|nr:T9SS type A sorting domain-containing protein [Ignavibacteria bacterium]
MKKLFFLELILLFLATTFQSHNPPGWYQQTLPVNDFVNDIFFLDSLNGWVVTEYTGASSDTGYILKTNDGGINWVISLKVKINFNVVQFLNDMTGYVAGGDGRGKFLTTTDGGNNWNILNLGADLNQIQDLQFINPDTGWICSDNIFGGGVFKTLNGGINWIRLTDPGDFTKLFFLNKDTGWVNANGTQKRLYRTINGGMNWDLQFTFPQPINDIFFVNGDNGFVSSGRMYKTTDGGINWVQSSSNVGGIQLSFVSDSIGWSGVNFNIISKTVNGGITWYYQSSPIFNNSSVNGVDTTISWAGGSGLVHTNDGGPPSGIINTNNTLPENYKLYQNFPNPFNPSTAIIYKLQYTGYVTLKVFNSIGKQIRTLVNEKKYSGEYKIDFDGSNLPSGVYFYSLEIKIEKSSEVFTDTKKMILIR